MAPDDSGPARGAIPAIRVPYPGCVTTRFPGHKQ